MFAPKVAKAQTKAAENPRSTLAPQRSTLAGHRLGHDPVEHALFLQRTIGNQATLRLLARQTSTPTVSNPPSYCEQEGGATENTTARETSRGASWDFSKIPLFPPDRASRSRGSSPQPDIIQRKLVVGQASDPLEHEADRAADLVMRVPDLELSIVPGRTQLSRKCAACEEEDKKKVQMKPAELEGPAANEAPPIVHEVLRSPGQPLDAATRAYFEPRFGHDFSKVRVHTDANAAESTTTVNARAYTVGNNLVFGAGEYAPETDAGRRLLSHELTHVVQQSITLGNSVQVQRRATPEDEKKKTEAVKMHKEQQKNVAKLLQDERAMATTTLKDPLDPHNVYRNTVDLLDNKKIRLILLTPTHYSTKDRPVYFDTRVAYDKVDGDYPAAPDATSAPGLVHPSPGELGATPRIPQMAGFQSMPPKVEGAEPAKSTAPPTPATPPVWSSADVLLYLPSKLETKDELRLVTKDELRDVLIHEGQHVADWSYLIPLPELIESRDLR
jgi:hypothetical protein